MSRCVRATGILALLLLVNGFALWAPSAHAQEIESRYQLAVTQFYQVQHDASGSILERAARWHAVAQTFQRIYRDAPTHRRGADSAFSAAIALRESWLLTRAPEDASEALAAFRTYSTAYPDAALAEDSLMHQAALQEALPDGSQAAYELYRKVAMRSPPGPQAPLARSRLNALLREQSTREDAVPAVQRSGSSGDSTPLTLEGVPTPAPVPVVAATQNRAPKISAKSDVAHVRRVQVLSALQFTRIIVTTDRLVKPKVEHTPGPQGQVRVDFKHTLAAPDLALPRIVEDGVLKRATVSSLESKGTRLAFDVGPLERYDLKTFELPVETKLVIDLYPQRKAALADAAGTPGQAKKERKPGKKAMAVAIAKPTRTLPLSAAPPSAANADPDADRLSLKASLGLKVRTVMIDPGHGGHDPGAIAFGVQEKDVALEIARRLKAILQKRHPDVRVGMTRDEDRFIPLGRRPKLAKAFGADLFVSIHLNASPAERLQGVETYFLNLTSDSSALAVAARENATSEKKVSDLNVILLDLLRDTNILESSKLAQALHTELVDTLQEGQPVKDLGVKQAPFMVLIGAEMPSVLVEAGFMTNRGENERLKSAGYLDKIANGIYAGLDRYIANEDIAQAKPRSRLLSHVTN